jgi:hypothetical protein
MRPAKGKALAAATADEGFGNIGNADNLDSRGTALVGQALQVIEGENQAHEFLRRLRSEQADAHDLAVSVSMLYGARLRGFCSVLTKMLGGGHA